MDEGGWVVKVTEAVALGDREEWSLLTSSTSKVCCPALTLSKVYAEEADLMADAGVGWVWSNQM